MIRLTSVAAACLLLAACSMPYKKPIVEASSGALPGIADAMARTANGNVDVVSIHGMCNHTFDSWVIPAGQELARAFEVMPVSAEEVFTHDGLQLFRARLSTSAGIVTHYSVVWSPISEPLKRSLCYDNGAYPDGYQGVCSDTPFSHKRAGLNSNLKTTLVNDCLSDVPVYLGPNGSRIRDAVRHALTHIRNAREISEPLFLITESLGSRIIYDALTRQDQQFTSQQLDKLTEALAATEVIYMAANQLPLLDIALTESVGKTSDTTRELLMLLDKKRKSIASLDAEREPMAVAFTDPNDLLSYSIAAESDVNHINVIVSNGKTWFGTIENPWAAHTGYLDNERVWELIVNGN